MHDQLKNCSYLSSSSALIGVGTLSVPSSQHISPTYPRCSCISWSKVSIAIFYFRQPYINHSVETLRPLHAIFLNFIFHGKYRQLIRDVIVFFKRSRFAQLHVLHRKLISELSIESDISCRLPRFTYNVTKTSNVINIIKQ